MRLYITSAGTYAGTQADAGKGFTQIEVPTDKAGLLEYLNGLRRAPQEPAERVAPTNPPPSAEERSSAAKTSFTATEIEAFILDYATIGQVEGIFAVLGTRFAELRK